MRCFWTWDDYKWRRISSTNVWLKCIFKPQKYVIKGSWPTGQWCRHDTKPKEVYGSWPDLQKKPSTCCPFSKVGSRQRQAWQDVPQQCSPGPPGGAWASPRSDGLRTEQRILWLSRVSNCRVNVHMWKPARGTRCTRQRSRVHGNIGSELFESCGFTAAQKAAS